VDTGEWRARTVESPPAGVWKRCSNGCNTAGRNLRRRYVGARGIRRPSPAVVSDRRLISLEPDERALQIAQERLKSLGVE